MADVVKFPYSVSRRVHSRRPRRSKNGTPEERASKAGAAAAGISPATVTALPGRRGDNHRLAEAAGGAPTLAEFLQKLKAYFLQELATGKGIDLIFDNLEGSYRRASDARPLKR